MGASKDDAQCVSFYAEGSETRKMTDNTVKLSEVGDLTAFDAVFFVGGFGTMCASQPYGNFCPLRLTHPPTHPHAPPHQSPPRHRLQPRWDFPDDADVQRIAKDMWEAGKVVSAVCHGPCALANVTLSDGSFLVAGKEVTAFTNEEEDAVGRRTKVGAWRGEWGGGVSLCCGHVGGGWQRRCALKSSPADTHFFFEKLQEPDPARGCWNLAVFLAARALQVPWTCQDKLAERGATFKDGGAWSANIAVSGEPTPRHLTPPRRK